MAQDKKEISRLWKEKERERERAERTARKEKDRAIREKQMERAVKAYQDGVEVKEIRRMYGIRHETLSEALKKAGVPLRGKGADHGGTFSP